MGRTLPAALTNSKQQRDGFSQKLAGEIYLRKGRFCRRQRDCIPGGDDCLEKPNFRGTIPCQPA